jgi:hypothetical protein
VPQRLRERFFKHAVHEAVWRKYRIQFLENVNDEKLKLEKYSEIGGTFDHDIGRVSHVIALIVMVASCGAIL